MQMPATIVNPLRARSLAMPLVSATEIPDEIAMASHKPLRFARSNVYTNPCMGSHLLSGSKNNFADV